MAAEPRGVVGDGSPTGAGTEAIRDRFDAQRLGLAAFERLATFLATTDSAQHLHNYEQLDDYRCRHIANRDECWLCVQLGTVRAALDNAYERSLPPVIREARRG